MGSTSTFVRVHLHYINMHGRHAIVEELAGFGARVHTCSRNAADLEECRRCWAEKGLSVTISVCDVAVRADRERLMDTVKATFDAKLDILVILVIYTSRRPSMSTNRVDGVRAYVRR